MAKEEIAEKSRFSEPLFFEVAQCNDCKHYIKDTGTCPAYPNGIPGGIFGNRIMHNKVFDTQQGQYIFQNKELPI